MVRIELKALLPLPRYADSAFFTGKQVAVELPEGATGYDLLVKVGIDIGHAKFFTVNGRKSETMQVLRDGDFVSLFPPLAGG
jgi:molybdopterin converting factor small subunit